MFLATGRAKSVEVREEISRGNASYAEICCKRNKAIVSAKLPVGRTLVCFVLVRTEETLGS